MTLVRMWRSEYDANVDKLFAVQVVLPESNIPSYKSGEEQGKR